MKKLMTKITDNLADAALLEMGVPVDAVVRYDSMRETLEENLVEIAFAEAADYDDIHKAILFDHRVLHEIARPDECQYGDNDTCFV